MNDLVQTSRWDGHQLLVAALDGDLTGPVAWVDRGLRRGEKVLCAADAEHVTVDRLVASLAGSGLDVARAAEDGRLAVIEAARFYSIPGYQSLVDEALRQGHRGVRSLGGPHAAAAVLDAAGFAEFERALERLWTSRGAAALCRYPSSTTAGQSDELGRAVARHPSGWRERMLHAYWSEPGRLHLVGEVDSSNDHVLAALLAATVERCGAQLVLDCTDLTFVSVGGWRAMAQATAPLRERGGRVRVAALSPFAARVLRMTGHESAFDVGRER
jgi:anti-anti-sigma factor